MNPFKRVVSLFRKDVQEAVVVHRRGVAESEEVVQRGTARQRSDMEMGGKNTMLTESQTANVIRQSQYLYDTHGLAEQMITRIKTFIYEGGFDYSVKFAEGFPEDVAQAIEKVLWEFWEGNRIRTRTEQQLIGSLIDGESGFRCFVDPSSGRVIVADLLREDVKQVEVDPYDRTRILSIEVKDPTDPTGYKTCKVPIISPDQDPMSATYRHLIGEAFYMRHLSRPSSKRGKPELQTTINELSEERRFRFLSRDRIMDLLSVFYQVVIKGADTNELEEYKKQNSDTVPRHGRRVYTNESVEYKPIQADMKGYEVKALTQSDIGFIAASKGFPASWFGFGEDTNYATAKTQDYPAFGDLFVRQTRFIDMYRELLTYVVDQSIIHNYVNPITGKYVTITQDGITKMMLIRDAITVEVTVKPLPKVEQGKEPMKATATLMDIFAKEAVLIESTGEPIFSTEDRRVLLNAALAKDDIQMTVVEDKEDDSIES